MPGYKTRRSHFQLADGLAAYYAIGISLCALLCYLLG